MDIISYALSKKGMQQSVSDYLDEHLTNPTNPPLDTSLEIAGAAADSKATGDKLSELKEDLNAIEQTQGYNELDINSATTFGKRIKDGAVYINGVKDSSGEYPVDGWAYVVVTAGTRFANVSFLTESISELSSGDTPSFCVGETAEHKVNANTTEVFKVPSDCTIFNVSRKIANIMQVPLKIMIIKTGGLTEKCYNFIDPTLSKSGESADAKVTGDKINALADAVYKDVLASDVPPTWKQGNFNGTTGVVATGTITIISNDYISSNVNGISVNTDGYLFSVFAYDSDDSYIGLYDATSDSYKKSGWSNYWITDFDVTKQNPNGYKLKLRIKNSDGTTITADKADKLTYKVVRAEYLGSTNPCEYDWKYEACTFAKMLCIGDSLIEGGANAPNITPDDANATRMVARGTYSIPNFLTKFFGIETTNWGISGSTSRSWYNSKSSDSWSGYDSALIYIGSNDYNYVTSDGMTIEEGANLSETMIRNIITKLKADNAGIRIFLCTLSPGTTDGAYAQYRLPLMEKIRTIANDTSGVYLIDLNIYSQRKSGLPYGNGHPTAIGYQWMAREIGAYICWWISHYPSEFKWIRWIGTRYAVTGTAPDSGDDDGGYGGDVQ